MDYVYKTNVWAQILTEQWEPLSLARYCRRTHTHTHTHTHTRARWSVIVCGEEGTGYECQEGYVCSKRADVLSSAPTMGKLHSLGLIKTILCVWAWHTATPLLQPTHLFMYDSRAPPRPRWSEKAVTWTHNIEGWRYIKREFSLFCIAVFCWTVQYLHISSFTTFSINK